MLLDVTGSNVTWLSFWYLQPSDANGLGGFSSMLPTEDEEADVPGRDSACCPGGDCCHSCSGHITTSPFVQCGGPHQVISQAYIYNLKQHVFIEKTRKLVVTNHLENLAFVYGLQTTFFVETATQPLMAYNCKYYLNYLDI